MDVAYPPIPYGDADFKRIRLTGSLYVDKTRFLRRLEHVRFAVLIRPRRFGKSCWISLLEHYYDRARADAFERVFRGTDVGRQPTEERHRYVVLRFDFSAFNSSTDFDLLRHVAGEERVACDVQPGFPLERLTRREHFLSLLHFFGLLSIREVVDGRPVLAIPNQTVRRLLYGFLRDAYDDVGTFAVDLFAFDRLMSAMANAGAWRPVFEFLRDAVAAQTGIRDYIAGEKVLQGFLAAYLSVSPYFVFRSEAELGKRYADIVLEPLLARYPHLRRGYLIELKYIKRSDPMTRAGWTRRRRRPPGSSAAISPTAVWRDNTRPCASSAWASSSTAGSLCTPAPWKRSRQRVEPLHEPAPALLFQRRCGRDPRNVILFTVMGAVFIYWDNSNIFISAKEIAVEHEGEGARPRVRIHFRNLLELARAGRPVHYAVAVGSVPPELRYVWNRLENEGVDVRLLERGAMHGREEGVDQLLQTCMLRDLSDYNGDPGIAVLLTGDGAGFADGAGFHADLARMHRKGWGIEVLSWRHSCSRRMREWAEENGVFVALDDFYESVTFLEAPAPGQPVAEVRNVRPLDLTARALSEPRPTT